MGFQSGFVKIVRGSAFLCACFCLLAGTCTGYQGLSVSDDYIIKNYTGNDGLPTKTITDITVGEDGYLYLASIKGLIRMDGIHMDVFSVQNTPGLKSDRISRIFNLPSSLIIKDQQGFLYRFKQGTAIPLLDPENDNHINTPIIKRMSENAYFILNKDHAFFVDEDSVQVFSTSLSTYKLWDASITADSTIYILNTDGFYSLKNGTSNKIPFPDNFKPDLSFFSRILEVGGRLRIIGRHASPAYDPKSHSWDPIHSIRLPEKEEEIMHIKKLDGKQHRFLISTSAGFYVERNGQLSRAYSSEKAIRYESVFQAEKENILVAFDGVWIDNKKIFEPTSNIIDADLDGENGLWISTAHEGVFHIRKNKFKNYTDRRIINSYSIARNNNNLWIGSFENGLIEWNQQTGVIQEFTQENQKLPSNTIRMISPLQDHSVLVSVWGEPPFIIRDQTITQLRDFFPLFGPRTNVTEAFYESPNGRWWLGTLDGLFVNEGGRFHPYFDNNKKTISRVSKIIPSSFNDDLFFCTGRDGLVLLRGNEFYFLSESLPASSKHIRDAYISSPDTIWAASYNSGLHRYILKGEKVSIQVLNSDNGLDEVGYHRIIPDTTGYFWISSNKGLLRVSEKALNKSANKNGVLSNFQWFTTADGLADAEFNGGSQSTGLTDESGNIWFTNMAGVVTFNPYDFSPGNLNTQNFKLQKLVTNNRTIHIENKYHISLEKEERNIRLRFAHLSFENNQTGQIWYRTSEHSSWAKPEKTGLLTLKNLPRGITSVEFSQNPDNGIILASLDLNIEPYWYEKAWFQVLMGMILIGVPGFIIYSGYKRYGIGKVQSAEPTLWEKEHTKPELTPKDPIKTFIDEHFQNPNLTIDTITDTLNVSRSSLYRTWKKTNSESIMYYLSKIRLQHARHLMSRKGYSVTEAALASGFNSQSYFSKVFKKEFGMSPTEYLNNMHKS